MTEAAPTLPGNNTIKEVILIATLVFCAATVVYAMIWEHSEAIAQSVITMSYSASAGIIAAWIFGKAYASRGAN